jgi:hypothetical protein
MPLRELRAKYGKTSGPAREAINRAIRAEVPGGGIVLDLLALTRNAADRLGWEEADGRPSLLRVLHERLAEAANEMDTEIRRRYNVGGEKEARRDG